MGIISLGTMEVNIIPKAWSLKEWLEGRSKIGGPGFGLWRSTSCVFLMIGKAFVETHILGLCDY